MFFVHFGILGQKSPLYFWSLEYKLYTKYIYLYIWLIFVHFVPKKSSLRFSLMIAAERLEKKYVLENGHDVDRK